MILNFAESSKTKLKTILNIGAPGRNRTAYLLVTNQLHRQQCFRGVSGVSNENRTHDSGITTRGFTTKLWTPLNLAGGTGFEPVHVGIKIRCLTNLANLQQKKSGRLTILLGGLARLSRIGKFN
jgi:hypothetical protein